MSGSLALKSSNAFFCHQPHHRAVRKEPPAKVHMKNCCFFEHENLLNSRPIYVFEIKYFELKPSIAMPNGETPFHQSNTISFDGLLLRSIWNRSMNVNGAAEAPQDILRFTQIRHSDRHLSDFHRSRHIAFLISIRCRRINLPIPEYL